MAPPFEAKWSTLELADVQAFLDSEHEEGLTWEAKGGETPRPEHVRKTGSGFANAIGGSLILGAERDGNMWRLPGMTFPGGEARTWLSNVIRELSPAPRFDVRVFPVDGGRVVAIAAVEPIDVPPCMSGGSVFERVSGQTVPVTDPSALRALFARGKEAEERAFKLAHRAASDLYIDPLVPSEPYRLVAGSEGRLPGRTMFGFALASVGWPDRCRAAVFQKSFGDDLLAIAARTQPPQLAGPATLEQTRECLQATMPANTGYWVVRIYADGAAAVAFGSERVPEYVSPAEVMTVLEKAWRVAVETLKAVGASGDACLALHLLTTRYPPDGIWRIHPKPTMNVLGRTSIEFPSAGGLASVRRQLEREAGHTAWDPEE